MPYMLNDFASNGEVVDTSADRVMQPYAAILVTGTGNIRIETVDGKTLTIPIIAAPFVLPYAVRRVVSAGTTIPAGNVFSAFLN
jgi:hypothetical protein